MNRSLEEVLNNEWCGGNNRPLSQEEEVELNNNRGKQTIKYIDYCKKQQFKLSSPAPIKAKVISLDGSPRRKAFEQNASRAGLEFEYFNAVNGFAENLDVFGLDVWGLESMPKHWEISKGHMACTLSHLSLYKEWYDSHNTDEWYLVLEDDCYFHPYFSDALDKVIQAANSSHLDIDVISLSNRASHWLSMNDAYASTASAPDFVSLDQLSEEISSARKTGYAEGYSPKQTRVFGTESILFNARALEKLKRLEAHYGGKLLGEYLGNGPFGIEAILQHHLGRSPSQSAFNTPQALIDDGWVAEGRPYLNSFILTLPLTTTRDWLGERYFSETRRKKINQKR